MTILVALAVIGLSLAFAAQAHVGQQTQLGVCNKEAGVKKGVEREAFMKTCMSEGRKREEERMQAQRRATRQE